ncbi:MAG TPA: acylphosphatase [Beutenbergiaceae bacterium]|nr:acylphosphatase [Beutenbergiaceae bacterium]
MNQLTQHLIVHGRVQGVNFRNACRRQARDLGVLGWVRNMPDGTVEVHAQGPAQAVRDLVDWAHHGPRNALVSKVEINEAEWQELERFDVR